MHFSRRDFWAACSAAAVELQAGPDAKTKMPIRTLTENRAQGGGMVSNPAHEARQISFEAVALPVANRKKMGVIASSLRKAEWPSECSFSGRSVLCPLESIWPGF